MCWIENELLLYNGRGVKHISKFDALIGNVNVFIWLNDCQAERKRQTSVVNTHTYIIDIWVPSIHSYIPGHKNHSQSCKPDFPNNFHCKNFHILYHKSQHYILISKMKDTLYIKRSIVKDYTCVRVNYNCLFTSE